MHDQRFIINIVICHTQEIFDNTSYFMMVDHSTVQHHFYDWNNWVTLAPILDSDTFIEEQPHKVINTWSRMSSC